MKPAGQQLLGFFLAFGALALVAGIFIPRLLGLAAGPEAEVTSILKRSERQFQASIAWGDAAPGPLRATKSRYERITVVVAPDRNHAIATATLDFEGQLGPEPEASRVSSLGFEEVPFTFKDGEWLPDAGLAPRLSAVVAALEARRQALERGDRESVERLRDASSTHPPGDREALDRVWRVADRKYRVVAWYIRGERGEVQVTERYRLTGVLPDVPVDERGMRQFRLRPKGREFFFVSALM